MKKFVLLLSVIALVGATLIGCQSKPVGDNVLRVGATPVPHSEILEIIKEELKKENIELKIVEFTDYIKPNLALAEGEIEANFFQHLPYMESFAKDRKLDIVSLGSVHVEPLGLYSSKLTSIDDFKKGDIIAIPNDPTNQGRALIFLQANGVIKLKANSGLQATEIDIIENPKGLVFRPLEAAQLPRVLGDVSGAIINGNYALEAGLVPTKDALIIEDKNSPYANIVAVRKGEEDSPKLKALLKALQSQKVKDYIENNYKGGVVPAF